MAGSMLGDRYALRFIHRFPINFCCPRCSQYRGSTVEFTSCLNLTNAQFVASTNPNAPTAQKPTSPFKPRFGPRAEIQPAPGQQPASGFRPAPQGQQPAPRFHIMTNPNRGRGAHANGRGWHRGGPHHQPNGHADGESHHPAQPPATNGDANHTPAQPNGHTTSPRGGRGHDGHRGRGGFTPHIMSRGGAPQGGPPVPPRGGFMGGVRGRGGLGFAGHHSEGSERGRGRGSGRGFRGRGRGQHAPPVDA
jgi:hypothetical protein